MKETKLIRMDEIESKYEDRVCGRVSPRRYDIMVAGYESEQSKLKQSPMQRKQCFT